MKIMLLALLAITSAVCLRAQTLTWQLPFPGRNQPRATAGANNQCIERKRRLIELYPYRRCVYSYMPAMATGTGLYFLQVSSKGCTKTTSIILQ